MNINKPYRPNLKIFIQKVLDETKNIEIKQYEKVFFPYYEFHPIGYEDISLKTNNIKMFNQIGDLFKDKIDELKWRNIKFHNCYITQYFINHNPDGIEFNLNFSHVEYET